MLLGLFTNTYYLVGSELLVNEVAIVDDGS